MSLSSTLLSPIRPDDDQNIEEQTDEEHQDNNPLNISAASSSSNISCSSDNEVPAPSSSAAGILRERRQPSGYIPPDEINLRHRANESYNLQSLNERCSAQHYYNNTSDEQTFLTESFLPFMGLIMTSNIIFWLRQSEPSFVRSTWFRLFGYKRIFLEALEQTMSRLPFPRVYNFLNARQWVQQLHEQSPNCKLLVYPWKERPTFTPFSYSAYKPITEHYGINMNSGSLQGFVIGLQGGVEPNLVEPEIRRAWLWKYEFFCDLPLMCLNFVQNRLPGLNFDLARYEIDEIRSEYNNTGRGYWSVVYDEICIVTSAHADLDSEDDAPQPEPIYSGSGFSTIDQTFLAAPYRSPGQSSLPTEHLQPGYCPLVAPYAFSPGYHLFQPFPVPIDPSVTYSLMPADLRAHITALTDKVDELTRQLASRDEELKTVTSNITREVEIGMNIRCKYLTRRMQTLQTNVRKQVHNVYVSLLDENPPPDSSGEDENPPPDSTGE